MPTHSSSTSEASSVGGILIQTASWLPLLAWGKTRQCLRILCKALRGSYVLPAGCGMLRARNTCKEGCRGVPVSEVIDKVVPRLSPPLLVDEALRCHSFMPPQ